MYSIRVTSTFLKTARKFFKRHPDLKLKFELVLETLRKNPFQPGLRLHSLKGELKGLHAVRLTYKFRITVLIKISPKEITLLDIGTHDEVYGN